MKDNKKLKVVNLLGGPGIGKSATAYSLSGLMKKRGMKIELIHEFAKELVWEKAHHMFTEQDYIFAQQHRLIRRLVQHDIDWAVTDSPLLLELLYMPEWFPKTFPPFLMEVFDTYSNINIMLERNPDIPYVAEGRNQTQAQAIEKDNELKLLLKQLAVPYTSFMVTNSHEHKILKYLQTWESPTETLRPLIDYN